MHVLDFDAAIKAHVAWKTRLSNYIENPDGSITQSDIKPDHLCVLGKWIYSCPVELESDKDFIELKEVHRKFHICAAGILRRADLGEKMDKELSLFAGSEYAELSDQVVSLIMKMRRNH